MDERPGAPWMCCFSEGGPVLGRLEDGRLKLTEFVKNAKYGQGMSTEMQWSSERKNEWSLSI
jgi:hypothetical protein